MEQSVKMLGRVLVPVHKIPKAFSISVFCVEGHNWNFAVRPCKRS
jgi:hypothetical protein